MGSLDQTMQEAQRTTHSSSRVHGVQLIQHRPPLLRRTGLDDRSGGRQSLPSETIWISKFTRNYYVRLSRSVGFVRICRCIWCVLIHSGFIGLLCMDAFTVGRGAIDGRSIDGKSVYGERGRCRIEDVFPTPSPGRRPRLLSGEIAAEIQLAKHALGEIPPNMPLQRVASFSKNGIAAGRISQSFGRDRSHLATARASRLSRSSSIKSRGMASQLPALLSTRMMVVFDGDLRPLSPGAL